MALAGGGPDDLLGYISTAAYWKAKAVQPTVEQLTADLASAKPADVSKLIDDLSAPDPTAREQAGKRIVAIGPGALPQLDEAAKDETAEAGTRAKALAAEIRAAAKALSVRRLMAIRTLGEMKSRAALPALQGMLESKEMFVRDYAGAAIAAIEGRQLPTTKPAADAMADVNLLPANVDMVCRLNTPGGPPLPVEKILGSFRLAPNDQAQSQLLERINANLVSLAETIGNIRLDSVTLGWFMAPAGQPGNAVIIARGQFDSAAIIAALHREQIEQKAVGASDAYMLDDSTALLVPNDNLAVLVVAETNGELPIEATLKALDQAHGGFAQNAELVKLAQSVDTSQPFWMVTRIADIAQMFDFLPAFKTATLVAKRPPGSPPLTVGVRLEANGADPNTVRAALDLAMAEMKQAADESTAEAQVVASFKPLADMAQSVKISAEGTKASATADVTLGAMVPFALSSGIRLDGAAGPPGQ
jgi:hypothetical protein